MSDMSCQELMRKIKELEFAAVDLNLFLDNNPTNAQALADYNAIVKNLDKYKKMYEMQFGPLTNFGTATSDGKWKWVNDPWPWESGE